MSISPPSFWMRTGRPACICARLPCFRTGVRSQSSRALLANVPVCGEAFWAVGRPQCEDEGTVRQRGGRQVCDSGYCTTNVTLFDFVRRGRFLSNGRLGISPQLPQCVSWLRFHVFPVPHCVVRPLGCVCDLFLLSLFSCRILFNMSSSSWSVADR